MLRTGDCFHICAIWMLDNPHRSKALLVHGLPVGKGGDAARVGQYAHAWIEDEGMVWDPLTKQWYPMHFYYQYGDISYTTKYTHRQLRRKIATHSTSGPWDDRITRRDQVVQEMIDEHQTKH